MALISFPVQFHFIRFFQWFTVDFSFSTQDCFIPLWKVFHSIFHSSVASFHSFIYSHPGLFHSIFHSAWQIFHSFISSLPWAISFNISFRMAGLSFIHFILAMGYFILCGRFFIHSFHPCPGLFHSAWQVFHSLVSSLPWDISFHMAGFSFIGFIPALGYFILCVLQFFLFCFVYLWLFIIFRSESWRCRFDSLLFDLYRCHTIDSLHCRSTDS